MTVRIEQIASTLRRAVQDRITRGLNDPRIRGLVSITSVEVAPDLSEAYIGVSVLPGEHAALTLRGLESASGRLRGEIGRAMRLRAMPRLLFRLDDSLKKMAALDAAIRSGRPAPADDAASNDDSSAEGRRS
jgi:ribosome-binding factor A